MRSHLVAVGIFLVALPAFAQESVPVKLPGQIDPGAKPTVYEETPISSIRKGAVISLKPSLFVDVNGDATRVLNPKDPKVAPKTVLGTLYEANPEIHEFCSSKPRPDEPTEFRTTVVPCDPAKTPGCSPALLETPLPYFAKTMTFPWYAEFREAKIARSKLYHACHGRVAKMKNFPGKSRVLAVINHVIGANNNAEHCGIELDFPGLSASTGRIRFQPETDVTLAGRPEKAGKAVIFSAALKKKAVGGQIKTLTCFNTKTVADIQNLFQMAEPPAHDPLEIEFGANPPANKADPKDPSVSGNKKKELASEPETTVDMSGGSNDSKKSGSIEPLPGEF
jgi:hypothetical protein